MPSLLAMGRDVLRIWAPPPAFLLLRILPRAGRREAAIFAILVTLQGVLPAVFIVTTGVLIGAVPGTVESGTGSTDGRRFLMALIALAVLYAIQHVVAPTRQVIEETLGIRLSGILREAVMRAVMAGRGIAHLENPAIADRIALAKGSGQHGPIDPRAVWALGELLASRLQGIVAALILAQFRWWAPLLLIGAQAINHLWHDREARTLVKRQQLSTASLRRAGYLRDVVLTPSDAKDVSIFGLERWFIGRYSMHWLAGMRAIWEERERHRGWMFAAIGAMAAGNGIVFLELGRAAVRGEVAVTAVAILAGAILSMETLGYLGEPDRILHWGAAPVPYALGLDKELRAASNPLVGTQTADGLPREGISFEKVSFRYPGSDHGVLDGLDLFIPAGQILAIVGENGAGKTSIVKLLARLYDPDAGRITIDGIDLRSFDPTSWRRRLGVIFQDFVHYELTLRENVGFGHVERLDSLDLLAASLQDAGAEQFIEHLPDGWSTHLSPRFRGGIDLSGGQWQRIALARALFARKTGASVLVLDEPTANLDVRAEVELFERIIELSQGTTTILVSHRFSSVRHAQHIIVVSDGHVIESGTHHQLMALGGRYAEMFSLQAARFQAASHA